LAPVSGGEPIRTGLGDILKANNMRLHDSPVAWNGSRLVFAARKGHTTNLWQLELPERRKRISGHPERLTTSTQLELGPSMLADGQVIYTSVIQNVDVLRIPVRPGAYSQVTDGDAALTTPTVSRDGTRLVFGRRLGETREIWSKNLGTGKRDEHRLVVDDLALPWISPDGRYAAYSVQNRIHTFEIDSRKDIPLCPDCGEVIGWKPDNSAVMYRRQSEILLLDVASRARSVILSAPGLRDAAISPDQKWLAYTIQQRGTESRIHLRRLDAHSRETSVAVTEADTWSDHPAWSDDGSTLFYMSERDGFQCVWRRKIDGTRMPPPGAPEAVHHFHAARLTPSQLSHAVIALTAAGDSLYLNAGAASAALYSIRN
jgi:Tol biopolymer transport system component